MQHLRKNMQKWIIRYLWGVQLTLKVLTFSLKGDRILYCEKPQEKRVNSGAAWGTVRCNQ